MSINDEKLEDNEETTSIHCISEYFQVRSSWSYIDWGPGWLSFLSTLSPFFSIIFFVIIYRILSISRFALNKNIKRNKKMIEEDY